MSKTFYVKVSEIASLVCNYGHWQLGMVGSSGVYQITEKQADQINMAISMGVTSLQIMEDVETEERQSAQTSDDSDKSSGCDSGDLTICTEPGIVQHGPTSKFPEKYPDELLLEVRDVN